MAAAPQDPARPRISPIGIAMLAVLVIGLLFGAFMCSQRGGTVDGRPGTTAVTPPERLTTDDVQRATPGAQTTGQQAPGLQTPPQQAPGQQAPVRTP